MWCLWLLQLLCNLLGGRSWCLRGAWDGLPGQLRTQQPVPSRLPVLQEDVSMQQMRQLFALGQAALRRTRESAKAEALEELSALHAEQRALEDEEEARLKVCRGTETDCGIALQICDPLLSPPQKAPSVLRVFLMHMLLNLPGVLTGVRLGERKAQGRAGNAYKTALAWLSKRLERTSSRLQNHCSRSQSWKNTVGA